MATGDLPLSGNQIDRVTLRCDGETTDLAQDASETRQLIQKKQMFGNNPDLMFSEPA